MNKIDMYARLLQRVEFDGVKVRYVVRFSAELWVPATTYNKVLAASLLMERLSREEILRLSDLPKEPCCMHGDTEICSFCRTLGTLE